MKETVKLPPGAEPVVRRVTLGGYRIESLTFTNESTRSDFTEAECHQAIALMLESREMLDLALKTVRAGLAVFDQRHAAWAAACATPAEPVPERLDGVVHLCRVGETICGTKTGGTTVSCSLVNCPSCLRLIAEERGAQ